MFLKPQEPKRDLSAETIKNEKILRAFAPYRDPFGLFHDRPTAGPTGTEPLGTHGCGNSLLYTSHVAIALWINGARSVKTWRTFYEQALVGYKACEVKPGLFRRHPVHYAHDQESHDDYAGIATFCSFGQGEMVERIAQRGGTKYSVNLPIRLWRWKWNITLKLYWYFPNDPKFQQNFGFSAFLGRFIPLVNHVKGCSNLSRPIWQQLIWGLAIATAGFRDPKRNDVWILPWNMCMANRRFTKLELFFRRIFFKRLRKHWGEKPMAQVFRAYFGKYHPLCDFADGDV